MKKLALFGLLFLLATSLHASGDKFINVHEAEDGPGYPKFVAHLGVYNIRGNTVEDVLQMVAVIQDRDRQVQAEKVAHDGQQVQDTKVTEGSEAGFKKGFLNSKPKK